MGFDARPDTDGHLDEALTPELAVRDHREASRFEAVIDGQVAFLQYERRPDAFVFLHTEVPESQRGRGIATLLAKVGLQSARAEGLPIVVRCPFVRAYLQKHRNVAANAGGMTHDEDND
jgi:predicted GNAT family acetyltransferase